MLLPDSISSPRWETDDRRYFDGALNGAGVESTIVNAQGDPDTQRQQAQQALGEGAKVLILVNLDNESGAAIIANAHAAGAHVIDYDRLTTAGPGADIYISFDNLKVGTEMGQTLEPAINALGKEPPRIVQLNGSPTDNNATQVRAGYSGVATPYYDQGKWRLLTDQPVPDWDPQQAGELFTQILAGAGEKAVWMRFCRQRHAGRRRGAGASKPRPAACLIERPGRHGRRRAECPGRLADDDGL